MADTQLYTYVHFNVTGFTNNLSLSSYALESTPLTFIPDFTTATLLSAGLFLSNKILQWDFGDGTTSSDLTATHAYKWPGNYRITLNVFDSDGNVYISYYSPTVNIINVIEDQLIFKDYGRFIYDVPASKVIDPLTILRRNSYQTINSISAENFTINLYASGALGDYINLETYNNDKWAHLRSLSRFYEKQKIGDTETLTIVNAVTTIDTKIYARINNNTLELCDENDTGSFFVGSTGYAEIYYVDDRTKNFSTRESPIFVMATQDNWNYNDKFTYSNNLFDFISYPPQGFQTLQTAVQPIIKVRHNPASILSITTNGIDGEGFLSGTNFDLPKISWQNTEIPFLIKLKDNENFTTRTYPELSCLKIDINSTDNALLSTLNLQLDLVQYINGAPQRIKNVNFYSDFTEDVPRSIGSFYKGYFISPSSALTCKLTAGMLVVDPVNFPKDSLLGWICEPNFRYVQRLFKTQVFSFCTGSQTAGITGQAQHFPTPNDSANSFCVAVAPSGVGLYNDYQTPA
jgi:PKD repeat protein